MAGDRLDLDVVFNLAVANGRATSTQLNDVAKAAGRANTAGNITDKTYQNVSKAQARVGDSAKTAASGQRELNDVSQRYAQYDIASTLLRTSAAMAALGASTVVAFAQQEKAFTEVERILGTSGFGGDQIASLRSELIELSRQIPLTFGQLSEIAAFGAALDIPAQSLDEFADVVGRFGALTGTTTEEAGKGLARLAQYTKTGADGYENLGSAILRAGNISIATEQEVLRFSQALSPLASRASVSADYVVGLAAATASFANINVEGAGSAFSRVFANIERAAASGGETLDAFASKAGLSATDFAAQWSNNAGVTFQKVIEGMATSSESLVLQLDELGIRNERDRRVVQALVLNYEAYASIQERTTQAFRDGTALGDSYAYVLDDLATKFQLFLNNLQNAASAIGAVFAPAIGDALDVLSDLLGAFTDFAGTAGGRVFLSMAGGVLALATAWTALRGAIALATASSLAFKAAAQAGVGMDIASGLTGLAGSFTQTGAAATGAAAGMGRFTTAASKIGSWVGRAARALGPLGLVLGTALGGAIAFYSELKRIEEVRIDNLGAEFASVGVSAEGLYESVRKTFAGDIDFGGFTYALRHQSELMNANNMLVDEQERKFFTTIDTINAAGQAAEDFGNILNTAVSSDEENGLERAQAYLRAYRDEFNLTSDDIDAFLNGAGSEYRDQIIEQLEANNQLANAENIRSVAMGEGTAATRLSTGALTDWEAEANAAAEESEALNQELDDLLSTLQKFAGEGRNVADTQDALSGSFNSAHDAIAEFLAESGEAPDILTRTDDAARNLRSGLKQLGDDGRDAATALAEEGNYDAAIEKYHEARSAVEQLLDWLGVAPDVAKAWADDMFGETAAVEDMLQGVADKVNEIDQSQAIPEVGLETQEFDSKGRKVLDGTYRLDRLEANPTTGMDASPYYRERGYVVSQQNDLNRLVATPRVTLDTSNYYWKAQQVRSDLAALGMSAQVANGPGGSGGLTLWSGGYTGRGGMYEPAGTVHRGEYVIPKKDVNQRTGVPYADALQKLTSGERRPRSSYAQGGYVNPAPALTIDYQALAAAVAAATPRTIVADGREIARVVNNQDSRSTRRGAL